MIEEFYWKDTKELMKLCRQKLGFDILLIQPDEKTLELVLVYQKFNPIIPEQLRAGKNGKIKDISYREGKMQKILLNEGWLFLRASEDALVERYKIKFSGEKYQTHGEQIVCKMIFGLYPHERDI